MAPFVKSVTVCSTKQLLLLCKRWYWNPSHWVVIVIRKHSDQKKKKNKTNISSFMNKKVKNCCSALFCAAKCLNFSTIQSLHSFWSQVDNLTPRWTHVTHLDSWPSLSPSLSFEYIWRGCGGDEISARWWRKPQAKSSEIYRTRSLCVMTSASNGYLCKMVY